MPTAMLLLSVIVFLIPSPLPAYQLEATAHLATDADAAQYERYCVQTSLERIFEVEEPIRVLVRGKQGPEYRSIRKGEKVAAIRYYDSTWKAIRICDYPKPMYSDLCLYTDMPSIKPKESVSIVGRMIFLLGTAGVIALGASNMLR